MTAGPGRAAHAASPGPPPAAAPITRGRLLSRSVRALIPACLASLSLLGCGGGEEPDALPFPLRLLADHELSTSTVLLDDEVGALQDWWLLDPAAPSLRPLHDGDPQVQVEDDAGLRPRDPAHWLVRFVTVPAGLAPSFTARVGAPSPFDGEAPCLALHALPVATLEDGQTLEQILADGEVSLPGGRRVSLARRAAQLLDNAGAQPRARWIAPPDQHGRGRARLRIPATETATLRAVCLGPGLLRGGLVVEERPELDSPAAGLDFAAASSFTAPTVAPVQVGGDLRPALVLPPGTSHTLQAPVPSGQAPDLEPGLELGVSYLPGSPFGAAVAWSIDGNGAPLAAATGQVTWLDPVLLRWDEVRADVGPEVRRPAGVGATATDAGGPGTLRLTLTNSGAVPLAFAQPLLTWPEGAAPRRPNVLLVSIDTLRADHLSSQGYPRPTTPRLDELAREAVHFTGAASVSPFTLPSHATLFSGWLPLSHGVVDGGADRVPGAGLPYLPSLLARAGWHTAAFTGGGFLSADYGFARGFDRFETNEPVPTVVAVPDGDGPRAARAREVLGRPPLSAVREWIADRGERPWFAFVHTFTVHDYLPPPGDRARFDRHPDADPERKQAVHRFLGDRSGERPDIAPDELEMLEDLYDATLAHVDRELGRLLDDLRRDGLLDDTIVIVTSDHGEEFGDHGHLKHSRTLYEEMLHVPLIVRAPGLAPRVVDEPVSLADVTPTVLELLGLDDPSADAGFPRGVSLVPLLERGAAGREAATPLVGHVDTLISRRVSLRQGRYKLIRGDMSERLRHPAPARWELFDLAADPTELTDLADERPNEVQRLAEHLQALELALPRQLDGEGAIQLSPELLEQLRELGYF